MINVKLFAEYRDFFKKNYYFYGSFLKSNNERFRNKILDCCKNVFKKILIYKRNNLLSNLIKKHHESVSNKRN